MFSNVVHFSQIYLPKRSGVTLCKTRLLYTFTAYCFQILHRLLTDKNRERDEIELRTAFQPNQSQLRSQWNESQRAGGLAGCYRLVIKYYRGKPVCWDNPQENLSAYWLVIPSLIMQYWLKSPEEDFYSGFLHFLWWVDMPVVVQDCCRTKH